MSWDDASFAADDSTSRPPAGGDGGRARAPPRLHVDVPLVAGRGLALPARAARHVQVLRLQPGDAVTLFDGAGGQWHGEIESVGRRDVRVRPRGFEPLERELARPVVVALAMPANERMDTLVEKAVELGAAAIVPLVSARSVLRVDGERGARKSAHWRAVAAAAAEQCGRNRVPDVAEPRALGAWLRDVGGIGQARLLLSLDTAAAPIAHELARRQHAPAGAAPASFVVLGGPEGGWTADEEHAALAAGFVRVSLGPRVLRADTAPLAALAVIASALEAAGR